MVALGVAAVASYYFAVGNTEAAAVGNTEAAAVENTAAVVVESYLVYENLTGD